MCMASGHTASWGKGYPELLTDCYDALERPTGLKGPINPARNETYALLWQLLREAATAFPDSYIHLGGDEVPFDCWQVLLPPALLPARTQNCVVYACCRHPFLSSHSLQAGDGQQVFTCAEEVHPSTGLPAEISARLLC